MQMLLLYIEEGSKFDRSIVEKIFSSNERFSEPREQPTEGTAVEADFTSGTETTTVRLQTDLETVVISGITDVSLEVALAIQRAYDRPLHAIDLDYSFDILLSEVDSTSEFREKMISG